MAAEVENEQEKPAKVKPVETWKAWTPEDGKRKSCSAPGCKQGVENVKTRVTVNGDTEKVRRYMYCTDHTPDGVVT